MDIMRIMEVMPITTPSIVKSERDLWERRQEIAVFRLCFIFILFYVLIGFVPMPDFFIRFYCAIFQFYYSLCVFRGVGFVRYQDDCVAVIFVQILNNFHDRLP